MSEKFCIKRDDYETSITKSVSRLRHDKGTFDVTLVGNDGKQTLAHRNILSLNSDYIKELLMRNASPFPLIRIPLVNSEDLSDILDFIYHGMILLDMEDMESFINNSKKLKVKGMVNDTYSVDLQVAENEEDPQEEIMIIQEPETVLPKKEPTIGEKFFNNKMFCDETEILSMPNKKTWFHKEKTHSRSSIGRPPPVIFLNTREISQHYLRILATKMASTI